MGAILIVILMIGVKLESQVNAQAKVDKFKVDQIMSGLDIPWDIAFTPDGTMLVNERAGGIMVQLTDGSQHVLQADFDDLKVVAELGLMGMVVDPNFSTNRRLYTCQGDQELNQTKVVAWRINDNYTQAKRVNDPLVGGIPSSSIHNGCRLRFGPQGYLWITTGDAKTGSHPQDLNSLAGKVLRVNAHNGQAAPSNPFTSSAKAKLVYTFGHRNPQGLTWRADTQQMWSVEHGPDIDDEINLLIKGGNYGWNPVSSASNNYYQQVPMTDTTKYPQAIEAQWSSGEPTLATSGGVFLTGNHWGDKEGWLAVVTLKNKALYLFDFASNGQLKDQFMVAELDNTYGRLRTPMIGPDNALYIATSNGHNNDVILRVNPITPVSEVDPKPSVAQAIAKINIVQNQQTLMVEAGSSVANWQFFSSNSRPDCDETTDFKLQEAITSHNLSLNLSLDEYEHNQYICFKASRTNNDSVYARHQINLTVSQDSKVQHKLLWGLSFFVMSAIVVFVVWRRKSKQAL